LTLVIALQQLVSLTYDTRHVKYCPLYYVMYMQSITFSCTVSRNFYMARLCLSFITYKQTSEFIDP